MIHQPHDPEVLQVMQSQALSAHIKYRLYILKPQPNVSREDVLHYVILSFIEAIESGREVRNPVAYCKRIAERYIIKQYDLCRQSILVESGTLEFLENIRYQKPSSAFDTDDIVYLNSQIARLKDCERQIIQWRFFENFSWSQIAVLLSSSTKVVSEQTARQRGKRALDALRSLYVNDSPSY
ncbi:sigma-70 family RNA polymerase sigma factor [Nostoc sp.]|uniref:sigma-70 family RNA polymerase sigma factor n=1 Tax=Nostoc sp. TaxID=1180 RepID=UPI002FFAD71E